MGGMKTEEEGKTGIKLLVGRRRWRESYKKEIKNGRLKCTGKGKRSKRKIRT